MISEPNPDENFKELGLFMYYLLRPFFAFVFSLIFQLIFISRISIKESIFDTRMIYFSISILVYLVYPTGVSI